MHLYYLLFFFYFFITCLGISRIQFVKNAGLSNEIVLSLFSIKILTGFIVGWISLKYMPSGDYWGLHKEGLLEWEVLVKDPKNFFNSILYNPYHHYNGFFDSVGSYWNDLKNNILIKILAVLNNFSQGNYYINSLFLNFFCFLGHIALYKIFISMYPTKKWGVIFGCFLLPSTLFFSSAIHKDLIVFTATAFFSYGLFFLNKKSNKKIQIAILILSAITLLFIRNYIILVLVPISIVFYYSNKFPNKTFKIHLIVFGILISAICFIHFLLPNHSPLLIISKKQFDFLQLPCSNTDLNMQILKPTFLDLFKNLPSALNHVFLRPSVFDKGNYFLWISKIELIIYQVAFLIYLCWFFIKSKKDPFFYYCIFFVFFVFLIIGFTIPNSGSIVRYRSLFFPYIITHFICTISRQNKQIIL